jgi:hypothetical protein
MRTCDLFGHRRSQADVQRYGDIIMSRCRHCGERMVREHGGGWRMAGEADLAALRAAPRRAA